jgi:hypothetical protein
MICNFLEVVNFERLFLKLKQVICNYIDYLSECVLLFGVMLRLFNENVNMFASKVVHDL